MAVVAFDYAAWALRYPELASVPQGLAALYFGEACLYLDNTDGSPVQDVTRRAMLLNMLTAHIAALNAPLNGQPSSPLVGQIVQATEGSVTVQAKFADAIPGTMGWFVQTKYGAAFWQATAALRMARYVPGPQRQFGPKRWR